MIVNHPNTPIVKQMLWGFGLIFFLFSVVGITSWSGISSLGNLTSVIYQHPLEVSNASLRASMGVVKMHRSMKDIVLADEPFSLDRAIRLVSDEEKKVLQELDLIKEKILGVEGETLVHETEILFFNWRPVREEVIALVRKGDIRGAAQITKGKGAEHELLLEKEMLVLTSYARNKASGFIEQANNVRHKVTVVISLAVCLGFFASLCIAVISFRSVTGSLRKRDEAEEVLHHYKKIVSSSTDMLALMDERYCYTVANRAYLSAFNLTDEPLVGKPVSSVLGQKFFETVVKPNGDRCLRGEEVSYQDWINFPAYGRRYMDVTYSPYYNDDNKVIGFVVSGRNFTARKQAEDDLRKSEKKFKDFMMSADEGFVLFDSELNLVSINDKALQIYPSGATREDLTGKSIHEIAPHLEGTRRYEKYLDVITTGQSYYFDKMTPDPIFGDRSLSVKVFKVDSGLGFIFSDITEALQLEKERKKMEAIIRQQEKMASVGQLAAGVAHEINNPSGYISSNLTTLKKYISRFVEYIKASQSGSPPEELKQLNKKLKIDYLVEDSQDLIDDSIEGIDRIHGIVQSLKSFSRVDNLKCKEAEVNECIENTLKVIWNELKYKAKVIKEYGELPLLQCHPQQLSQVFMNIMINAAHAIDEEGEIKIKTWSDSENLFVAISDTGKGIFAENLTKIFEPFYTTKDVGKGTGLGLSIVHDIIQNHDGEIDVESEIGKGTTFTITLPVTAHCKQLASSSDAELSY